MRINLAHHLVWIVALAVMGLAGCGETGKKETPQQAQIADGLQIATDQCSTCHAIAASGESPNPKAPVFRTILSRYDEKALVDDLAEGIRIGHPDMPKIALRPEGVDALIAYLRSIQSAP